MQMFYSSTSPYIRNPNRLADLIAAIQVLGSYRCASRQLQKWEKRLGRDPVSATNWETIFKQHPEFFTIQGGDVSAVWRRSRERKYDTYTNRSVSREEALRLTEQENESGKKRLSRPPLSTEEISKLVDIAINLHEQEIKHGQERRWWISAVLAVIGLIISVAAS